MMKKILTIIAIVIIALFTIAIVKDALIKSAITVVASKVTGAPVSINGFSLGVLNQTVKISGLKIYNPQGFSKGILIDIAKANVKLDLGALFKKKIHLVEVEFDLKEMGLEKNKDKKLNVDSLKVAQQPADKQKTPSKPAEQMPISIDMFKLDMGKLIYKDFSLGGKEPSIQVYDINIHRVYKNITSVEQLAALILAEPMKAAGIQGAKIYGAAMLTGVAFLPVAAAITFAGRDSVEQIFNSNLDNAYEVSLAVLKQMGKVNKEDKAAGIIGATITSANVAVKLIKITNTKTQITISARKLLLPKPEIAGGVLYKIHQKIK